MKKTLMMSVAALAIMFGQSSIADAKMPDSSAEAVELLKAGTGGIIPEEFKVVGDANCHHRFVLQKLAGIAAEQIDGMFAILRLLCIKEIKARVEVVIPTEVQDEAIGVLKSMGNETVTIQQAMIRDNTFVCDVVISINKGGDNIKADIYALTGKVIGTKLSNGTPLVELLGVEKSGDTVVDVLEKASIEAKN